jgi:hypothetical protein
MTQIIVYWIGIIGIAGKGPNWTENYNPNRTIGELIHDMTIGGLRENNKRIEIFKHEYGNLNRYDRNDPYWNHSTKLSEYVNYCGGIRGKYIEMIYCIV